MKKTTLFILAIFILFNGPFSYADEYEKFDISYGMHERLVNEKYGEPLATEKLRNIIPISKKKALYEIDDSDYMILYFFSGRIYEIALLQEMSADEALEIFRKK